MERSEKRALYALGKGTFDPRSVYARKGRLALLAVGLAELDSFTLTPSGRELFDSLFAKGNDDAE